MEEKFYDGTKLLSMMDIDGKKPEIYMCTTNRLGGKTTFVNRWRFKKFLKEKKKTIWLYRWQNEIDSAPDTLFENTIPNFFPGVEYDGDVKGQGKYCNLYLNGQNCGYGVAINSADSIRKISSKFYDAEWVVFDEFQPESNKYCPDEITKFQSLHTSLARGGRKFMKYLPIIMLSNTVTIINPYYVSMGISKTLRSKDKFKRGKGYVLEQGFVEGASDALLNSGFSKAFGDSDYLNYSAQNKYLLDNIKFIANYKGKKDYNATVIYKGDMYGVYQVNGGLYCSDKFDADYYRKIACTPNDIDIGRTFKKDAATLINFYRSYFNRGCFYFSDLNSKDAIFNLISY